MTIVHLRREPAAVSDDLVLDLQNGILDGLLLFGQRRDNVVTEVADAHPLDLTPFDFSIVIELDHCSGDLNRVLDRLETQVGGRARGKPGFIQVQVSSLSASAKLKTMA